MRPLIAIVGNTGVGKSQLAVELAKAFKGEIINADAMQMYQGLDIITNKHPLKEQEGIPHHLLGIEKWQNQITVQDFEQKATKIIDSIHSRNEVPILVGGTHYYIQSIITENALVNAQNEPKKLDERSFNHSQLEILNDPKLVEAELKLIDPVILAKFHPNDTRRLRRALEIWYETGKRPSEIYDSQDQKLRYKVLVIWVWCNRDILANRLDTRVDKMVKLGLMDEIKEMYHYYRPELANSGIWQVLGFRQFLDYLKSPSEEHWEAGLNSMKAETRQYAKKQRKWIKNKLCPLMEEIGGQVAVVDSSDLANWEGNVHERAISIVHEWLSGAELKTELVPSELKSETIRDRQDFDKSQWTRYKCDQCTELKGKEVILIGDDDWKIHQNSKSHRSAKRRLEKMRK